MDYKERRVRLPLGGQRYRPDRDEPRLKHGMDNASLRESGIVVNISGSFSHLSLTATYWEELEGVIGQTFVRAVYEGQTTGRAHWSIENTQYDELEYIPLYLGSLWLEGGISEDARAGVARRLVGFAAEQDSFNAWVKEWAPGLLHRADTPLGPVEKRKDNRLNRYIARLKEEASQAESSHHNRMVEARKETEDLRSQIGGKDKKIHRLEKENIKLKSTNDELVVSLQMLDDRTPDELLSALLLKLEGDKIKALVDLLREVGVTDNEIGAWLVLPNDQEATGKPFAAIEIEN